MRAADIMSEHVLSLEQDTTVREAARLMSDHRVGSLIVTLNGALRGVVTESDFTRKVVANGMSPEASLGTIMSPHIQSVEPETPVVEATKIMRDHRIKKLPVVKDGLAVGVITQTDVIRQLMNLGRELHQGLESGSMSANEFAKQFSTVFKQLDHLPGTARDWHMRCQACGTLFMSREEDGRLKQSTCPNCGSKDVDFKKT